MGHLETLGKDRDDLFWFIVPHSIFSKFLLLVCSFPDISTNVKKKLMYSVIQIKGTVIF